MKKFSFALIGVIAMLMGCTDYKAQIEDAYEETFGENGDDSGNDDYCNAMWCAKNGIAQVNTGYAINSWYSYTDAGKVDNPGQSIFLDGFGNLVKDAEIIDMIGSGYLRLNVQLDPYCYENNGYDPFAFLGFSVGRSDGSWIDINDWDGICITYQSDYDALLTVRVNNAESVTNYNDHHVVLTAGSKETKDFSWDEFKQKEMKSGKGIVDLRSVVLNDVESVGIRFEWPTDLPNTEPYDQWLFEIYEIGKYGTCGN